MIDSIFAQGLDKSLLLPKPFARRRSTRRARVHPLPIMKRILNVQNRYGKEFRRLLGQRLNGRHFTVTVEQKNEAAGRDPADTECRIYIGHDASFDPAAGDDLPHPKLMFVSGGSKLDRPSTLSFEHDPSDVIHDRRAVELDEVHLCARDVHVDTHGNLPDPWGRWTRMLYHIRATADSTGLIEGWADDQPITTVTGRIGFDEGPTARQYFKSGLYRNHPRYDSYAMLARYTRALRKEDIR